MNETEYKVAIASDFASDHVLGPQLVERLPAELQRQLHAMHFGDRLRGLRRALSWTQSRIAEEMGISVRTVIRHERGSNRRPHMRILLRLNDLESRHAAELLTYRARFGRGDLWLPGESRAGRG